jgi:hypothetical protein
MKRGEGICVATHRSSATNTVEYHGAIFVYAATAVWRGRTGGGGCPGVPRWCARSRAGQRAALRCGESPGLTRACQ